VASGRPVKRSRPRKSGTRKTTKKATTSITVKDDTAKDQPQKKVPQSPREEASLKEVLKLREVAAHRRLKEVLRNHEANLLLGLQQKEANPGKVERVLDQRARAE